MAIPTRRYYVNGAPTISLSSSITNSATSATVTPNFAGYPVTFPYFICLDKGTASAEIVSVTNVVGSVATIVRGQDGTLGVSHPGGATVDFVVVAKDYDEANAHTSATNAHGTASQIVGISDAQTLTNKTISGGTITSAALNSCTTSFSQASNAVNTGDATHPALVGTATTAAAKTLSLRNSSSTEHLSVDDAGNLSTDGTLTVNGGSGATVVHTLSAGAVASGGTISGATVTAAGTVSGAAVKIGSNGVVSSNGATSPTAQTGQATATFSASSSATVTATFATAYGSTPRVFPVVRDATGANAFTVIVTALSTTTVSFKVFQTAGVSITGSITIDYLAFG